MVKYNIARKGVEMGKEDTTPIIASFAVLRALNESKKYRSPYQLLGNFIDYIVQVERLHTFDPAEMRIKLHNYFGFNIPEAVIKSSLKTLEHVRKDDQAYYTDVFGNKDSQFIALKVAMESKHEEIVNDIFNYVKRSYPLADKGDVSRAVVSYLVDADNHADYRDSISTFILSNEDNEELQAFLNSVREGGILYLGINLNISECGSLAHDLTLYLDTEILFDLVGYNGSVYETLAKDFYQLVQKGRRKGKIALKYFSYVRLEVERFFKSAERLVDEQRYLIEERPAMKYIVNGCRHPTDVRIKMADFFSKLQSLSVLEDVDTDFYSEQVSKFDLESTDNSTDREQEGWSAISHINKLRRGQIYSFELDSHFILITDSRNVLETSKVQANIDKDACGKHRTAQYAISLNRITNLLWYKLDGGFGGEKFPSNASLLLRARTVISECIAKQVSDIYDANKEQYLKGEISKDQLASRVKVLREKPSLPEEIEKDNFQEALDFSSVTIGRLEAEIQEHRRYRAESMEKLAAKDATLKAKDAIIEKQNYELQKFRQVEEKRAIVKKTLRDISFWFCRLSLVVTLLGLVYYAEFKWEKCNKFIHIIINTAAFASIISLFWTKLVRLYRSIKRRFCNKKCD